MTLQSGRNLMGVTWWLVAMTIAAISLRFYARSRSLSHIFLDDWIMLAAVILLFASQILLSVVYAYGLGQTDDLTMHQMVNIFKFQWIYVVPVNVSSICSRISIAILLSRIFSVKKWFRWYLAVTTSICSCLIIVLCVVLFTSCSPASALWDPVVAKTAKCLKASTWSNLGYASQGMLTLTDVTFVLFPVVFIWKLNMKMYRKAGLLVIFSLGLFTATASIMKMILVQSTSSQHSKISSTIPSMIWSTTEPSFVIIMGCVPTFGPLTKLQFPSIRSFWKASRLPSYVTNPTEKSSSGVSAQHVDPNPPKLDAHTQKLYLLNLGRTSSGSLEPRTTGSQSSHMFV